MGRGWLVVLGFNTTLTANISWFPGFLTPVLTQLFFPKPPTTFSHMFLQRCEGKICRKEKSSQPWIKLTTTRVMSPTRSPLSHPGRSLWKAEKMLVIGISFFFYHIYYLSQNQISESEPTKLELCITSF